MPTSKQVYAFKAIRKALKTLDTSLKQACIDEQERGTVLYSATVNLWCVWDMYTHVSFSASEWFNVEYPIHYLACEEG